MGITIKEINHQGRVHIYYSRFGKVLRHPTKVEWSKRNLPEEKSVWSAELGRIFKIVNDYQKDNGFQPTIEYVKNRLKERQLKEGNIFISYMDDFIADRKKVKANSLLNYRCLEVAVKDYQELNKMVLTLDDITEDWLISFVEFLASDKRPESSRTRALTDNTINKRIVNLKTYCKYIEDKKKFAFPAAVKHYRPPYKYDTEIVHLNMNELAAFYNLQLTGDEEKVRDIFIFCAMTSLRYSDCITLNDSHVDKNFHLTKKPEKSTRNERYQQDLNDTAIEIWQKYHHNLNFFDTAKFNYILRKICKASGLFNEEIHGSEFQNGKEIKLQNPKTKKPFQKWELISSHTARRSFITNAIEAGIPINRIMECTSHRKISQLAVYIAKFGTDKNTTNRLKLEKK